MLANRTGPETHYPAFLKTCHLTQGWAHSTQRVKSYASLKDEKVRVPSPAPSRTFLDIL